MSPSQLASSGRKIYFKITSRLSFWENIDSFYGEETIFGFTTLAIKNVKKANLVGFSSPCLRSGFRGWNHFSVSYFLRLKYSKFINLPGMCNLKRFLPQHTNFISWLFFQFCYSVKPNIWQDETLGTWRRINPKAFLPLLIGKSCGRVEVHAARKTENFKLNRVLE